uniref:Cyclic nucleotide-binding domain-containing protein n=1 Tax=Macrostomum lignano TaxID=282301 RepID=A0A1I8FT36_9PLAT
QLNLLVFASAHQFQSLHRWIQPGRGPAREELGSRRLSRNRTHGPSTAAPAAAGRRRRMEERQRHERQPQRQAQGTRCPGEAGHRRRGDAGIRQAKLPGKTRGKTAAPAERSQKASERGLKIVPMPKVVHRISCTIAQPPPHAVSIAKEFVVDVSQPFYYRWLAVLSVAACYNLIFIVMRSAFTQIQEEYPIWPWFLLDYAADAVYAVDDVCLSVLGKASSSRACWSETCPASARCTCSQRWVQAGLGLSVPHRCTLLRAPDRHRWHLRQNQPADKNASDCRSFIDRTETRTNYPNLFRISNLILILLVVVHWNGCIYFSICLVLGLGRDSWTYPPRPDNLIALANTEPYNYTSIWDNLSRKYIYSFFWSTMILTTIGDVPRPVTDFEYAFMTVDFLVGVLIFAVVVGNVGSMITNMNAARTEFQMRMDGVKRYMEFRKVASSNARVIRWFDYLWTNKQSLDEERILGTLPDKLKAEIAIHVHFDTLKRVAIFQDCEPGLLVELVLKLKLQVYSPGDYICRKGDIGKEMYIVKRGKLSVTAKPFSSPWARGSVFGEVSILNIPGNKTGNRRTANVRSDGYSDLFCLSKNDLWEALTEYPDAKVKLLEKGQQVLRKDNLIDEEALAKALQDRESTERRVERLNAELGVLQTRFARMAGRSKTEAAPGRTGGFLGWRPAGRCGRRRGQR